MIKSIIVIVLATTFLYWFTNTLMIPEMEKLSFLIGQESIEFARLLPFKACIFFSGISFLGFYFYGVEDGKLEERGLFKIPKKNLTNAIKAEIEVRK